MVLVLQVVVPVPVSVSRCVCSMSEELEFGSGTVIRGPTILLVLPYNLHPSNFNGISWQWKVGTGGGVAFIR